MKYYDEFKYPDRADPGISGGSANVAEALGEAIIAFEELDEQLSTAIAFLLRRGNEIGQIVTAQLSFKAKINLFSSLFKHIAPVSENMDRLRELISLCGKAEEIRNQMIHSKWGIELNGNSMTRNKFTARAKHGLRQQSETLTPVQVEAIAHHCIYLAFCVDEFMYMAFGREYGEP